MDKLQSKRKTKKKKRIPVSLISIWRVKEVLFLKHIIIIVINRIFTIWDVSQINKNELNLIKNVVQVLTH